MKNLFLLFLASLTFTGVFAQYSNLKALGDREFKRANYYRAAYYYKGAIDNEKKSGSIPFYSSSKGAKEKLKPESLYIQYQLAESYRLCHNFNDAGSWYHKILSYGKSDYPLAGLWYGVCLRASGLFDDAITKLQEFKKSYNGSAEYITIADWEMAACVFAREQVQMHRPITIQKMKNPWNADGGDYALAKNGDNYWLTSSRLDSNSKTHSNNIYTIGSKNTLVPQLIAFKLDISKNMELGTPSIVASGKKMYLTGWNKNGDKISRAIFSSQFQNNVWLPMVKLNDIVNTEGYNAMQPFITPDGHHLFFASDRPGGEGGFDIWVSELDNDGNPVNAVNLGKTINTPLDEEAPFFDVAHQKLVFSSNGFAGLGGFDIFKSFRDNGSWSIPVNLGYPTNSSKDDLYYYEDPDDSNKFYLSSDRGSDCCLSLFELNYVPVIVSGKVISCDSNKALEGIRINLADSVSGKIVKQTQTGHDGGFTFSVLVNSVFKLTVQKDGYFNKNMAVSISDTGAAFNIHDICITAYKVNKPIVIKNILYDFNSAALRPESKIALDSVVTIMRDNPSLKIEIGSHTDSIGNEVYNLKLSGERAKSCVDYIISKGISNDKITAKGYGKSVPLAPNSLPNGIDNPAGRQLNRRTEFTVKEK